MKAGIISAGFNLRLISEGKPKGLLKINGKTLIESKIETLEKVGFEKIYFVIRKDSHLIVRYLNQLTDKYKISIIIIKHNSISPLDSTLVLKKYLTNDEGILVFNVDAIYNFKDLEKFALNFNKLSNADMVMWASPFLEKINEDPAFIKFNKNLKVIEYGKKIIPTKYVFGQIRFCSSKILNLQKNLIENKDYKMGIFIKYLIDNNFNVKVFKTNNNTYDIDTPEDLKNVRNLMSNGKL